MTTTPTPEERVLEGKREAARRRALLTPEQERELHFLLVLGTHRLVCGVREVLPNGRLLFREDLTPALLAEGCECRGVPMKVRA